LVWSLERLSVLVVLIHGGHRELDHHGVAVLDEVETQCGLIGGNREDLQRRRGLEDLDIQIGVGARRGGEQGGQGSGDSCARKHLERETAETEVLEQRPPTGVELLDLGRVDLDSAARFTDVFELFVTRTHLPQRVGLQVLRFNDELVESPVVECHTYESSEHARNIALIE